MPFLGPPIDQAPRSIIFDIGRVIIAVDFSRSFKALAGQSGRSHEQVLRELETDPQWQDWQEGRVAPRAWHKHIREKFNSSLDFDEFCKVWNSVLDPTPMLPENLFEKLGAKCRLALLSNTDPIHVAHMEAAFPFVRHFPARVYSCHVGASKPGPVIFHHTLREVDSMPAEAMFIDDVRENVVAAATLGITAFHFISPGELLSEFFRIGLWN